MVSSLSSTNGLANRIRQYDVVPDTKVEGLEVPLYCERNDGTQCGFYKLDHAVFNGPQSYSGKIYVYTTMPVPGASAPDVEKRHIATISIPSNGALMNVEVMPAPSQEKEDGPITDRKVMYGSYPRLHIPCDELHNHDTDLNMIARLARELAENAYKGEKTVDHVLHDFRNDKGFTAHEKKQEEETKKSVGSEYWIG